MITDWVFGLSLNVQGFVQPLGNTLISVEVIARPIQASFTTAHFDILFLTYMFNRYGICPLVYLFLPWLRP